MPHATSSGFQAFILCGAGGSLNPFNTNPQDFPKALLPLANRPLVWYPLQWCYRMGVNQIHIISPPESQGALEAALSQNPYLTSLPSPKPTVLAPEELELTSGTAELFRLSEVQDAITGDFIVLPCDLACELPGLSLLETWMASQSSLGNTLNSGDARSQSTEPREEVRGRKGGLAVYYDTKDTGEGGVSVKKEETDFISTSDPPLPEVVPSPLTSLRPRLRTLLLGMPSDTLHELLEDKKVLRTRRALSRKVPCTEELTKHRDAHIYFFPYWVKDWIFRQQKLESLGEDVVGWWAKAGWQDSRLAEKLQMYEAMREKRRKSQIEKGGEVDYVDLEMLSSTMSPRFDSSIEDEDKDLNAPQFASRVSDPPATSQRSTPRAANIPPLLAYIHPALSPSTETLSTVPLVRRIDTAPLLLSASLYLARFPSVDDPSAPSRTANPLSHSHKVHTTTHLPQRATITQVNTLIDANVSIAEKTTIKESVVGNLCTIETMARLNRCLLMEGVVVGEKSVLNGCIIGRRARIGAGCELRDCMVQEGYQIPEGTNAKGEKFEAGGLDEFDEDDMENGDRDGGDKDDVNISLGAD